MEVDWYFLKSSGDLAQQGEQTWAATMAIAHKNTGCVSSTSVLRKGPDGIPGLPDTPEGYTVAVAVEFLKRMCLETVVLQTDGEPAAVDFAERVKQA